MQEDKRIKKTKNHLKNTLLEMLRQKPFEQISVTELCNASETSRITFYTHYSDKFELIDDIFHDFMQDTQKQYLKLQDENNAEHSPVQSYCNLLDCILNLYFNHAEIITKFADSDSTYIKFLFYKYTLNLVELFILKESRFIKSKYSSKQTAGFICYGIWGFINNCNPKETPVEKARAEAKEILKGILQSDILTERNNA